MRLRRVTLIPIALLVALTALVGTASTAAAAGSILVKVRPNADVHALAARHQMVVRRNLRAIHWVELVRRPDSAGASTSAASLAGNVEADAAVRKVATGDPEERVDWDFVPRDPVFNPGIHSSDGTQVGWHFVATNFPTAWDLSLGTGVTVAVIDSEFDVTNPDLRDKLQYRHNSASRTLQFGTEDIGAQPGDVYHGSHTSGLVGARTDNNEGVAGACFECRVMAIKIGSESSGTFVDASFLGDLAEGLVYAANNGASVISMSLGEPRPYPPLLDAINYAASKGAVLVASAGNNQESRPGVASYPAAYPNVIGVGATDSKGEIAPFSNQGPYVDLVAPGVNVLSTVAATDPGRDKTGLGDKVPVGFKSGTSMSAPLVAGLAGLMRSVRPDLTAPEVEALMKGTARDLGAPGPDLVYGAGQIDAKAAVAAALAYVRPAPPAAPAPPPSPRKKRKRKFKKIPAWVQLEVRHRKGKLIYTGKLSTKPKCRAHRRVVLLPNHGKRPLARATTNRRGVFHFVLGGSPGGKVHAKVRSAKLGRTVCKAGRSQLLGG